MIKWYRVFGQHLQVTGSLSESFLESTGQLAQAATLLHSQAEAELPSAYHIRSLCSDARPSTRRPQLAADAAMPAEAQLRSGLLPAGASCRCANRIRMCALCRCRNGYQGRLTRWMESWRSYVRVLDRVARDREQRGQIHSSWRRPLWVVW